MVTDEKRIYPRLNLDVEDGYFGNLQLASEKFAAPIVNLSAGGFNVALPMVASGKVKEGDIIKLLNIAGTANLTFLENIKSEIRWIKAMNTPGYVSVGCKFLDVAEPVLQQIIRFVDTERKTRGQYSE